MRKRHFCLILTFIFVFILGGCGNGYSADKYVGDLITSIKKEDASKLSPFLDDGIADVNGDHALQFPDELKDSYLDFLQAALNSVEFEINGAKKIEDGRYSVQLTFTPLDINATTDDVCSKFIPAISSADLNAEMTKFLPKATAAVKESPVYKASTQLTLEIKKSGDDYSLDDEQLAKLFTQALVEPMSPYTRICEILDIQDYLTASLNAVFKNDYAQYCLHTHEDAATVQNTIESTMYELPDGIDPSYKDRYAAAMKSILAACQYTVGVPQKNDGIFDYTMDVEITPNTSFQSAMNELMAGTYYSEDQIDASFIETLEKYAAAPTYGEQTTMTVSVNFNTLSQIGQPDAELTRLIEAIFPTE